MGSPNADGSTSSNLLWQRHSGRCRLHVAHGYQGASFVNDAFVQQAGYLAAMQMHRRPVTARTELQPLNPSGCWDWWGLQQRG
jgi:hypothetical protein